MKWTVGSQPFPAKFGPKSEHGAMELQEILRQRKVTQSKADGVLTRFDDTNTCQHLVVYLQALRFTVIYRSVQICADVLLCSVVQHVFFFDFS